MRHASFLLLLFSLFVSGYKERFPVVPEKAEIRFFSAEYDYSLLKGDYLYISQTEVSNGQYLEYVNWTLKHAGREAYLQTLPDTQVWIQVMGFGGPFIKYYFRHPAYDDYPVVGITRAQALAYCRWQAGRIMESEAFKKLNIAEIEVRLPSEKEWEAAARGTLPRDAPWPWPGNTIRYTGGKSRDEGKVRLNVNLADELHLLRPELSDFGFITTPAFSYWPNTLGLYNICGNVAEWVEEGKTKGGSWKSYPLQAQIGNGSEVLNDTFRSATTGFRPVLEIIRVKTQDQDEAFSAKTIERNMVWVKKDLFASAVETDNRQWNAFLREQGGQYRQHDSGWLAHTRYKIFLQHGTHPKYQSHPAVHVPHRAALEYCAWLTNKYHAEPKRKYNKVLFRLPTEAEWEHAAAAGRQGTYFPWSGPTARNSKGCWLCNFTPPLEMYMYGSERIDSGRLIRTVHYRYPDGDSTISRPLDGAEFTYPVWSYFPNDFGLYNCSGNVAEMVQEPGISKGGSWASYLSGIGIQNRERYAGPAATLGLRVFMEVLEE